MLLRIMGVWLLLLAMIAAVSVTWLTVHMWRAGRQMKSDIEGRLGSSAVKPGPARSTRMA